MDVALELGVVSSSVSASEDGGGDTAFVGWLTDRFVCSSILDLSGVLCFDRRGDFVGDPNSDVLRRCPFDLEAFGRSLTFTVLSRWLFSSSMVSIPVRFALPLLLPPPCWSTDVKGGLGGALLAAASREGCFSFDVARSVGSGVKILRVGLSASRPPTASLLWAFENVG